MSLFRSLSLSAVLLAASAPALAATSGDAAQALPGAVASLPALSGALGNLVDPQALALIDQLRALQVTPQQAVGGVGALLGLAQSQLAADQYAQLAGAVPGLELLGGNGAAGGAVAQLGLGALGGLLGGARQPQAQPETAPVDSLAGVGQAFSQLGMDSGLVGQFAPILLQFLAGQGLAGSLLQNLGGIWGVPAPLVPEAATRQTAY